MENDFINQLAGEKWEEVNIQLHFTGGVNPTPFILGYKCGAKEMIKRFHKAIEARVNFKDESEKSNFIIEVMKEIEHK